MDKERIARESHDWDRCTFCGRFDFLRKHTCSPSWQVVYAEAEDYADEEDCWTTIYAPDAAKAAAEYVAQMDACAAHFTERAMVIVKDAQGMPYAFIVTGEYIPYYSADRENTTQE